MTRMVIAVLLVLGFAVAAGAAQGAAPPAKVATASSSSALVNLNTASVAQLETLPGIGKATAERILEYREKTPFKRIEDLMNVRGVGEKSFLKLKPLITVTTSKAERTEQQ